MTDEPEVDRVARLMHAAYVRFYETDLLQKELWRVPATAFGDLDPDIADAYRAAARAVLADLCPAPLFVSEESR